MSKVKAKGKVKELEITVVGIHYRLTPHGIDQLTECAPLVAELVREPENEYDENAIAVYLREKPFKDMKIGYVSRQVAKEIAPVMDAGKFNPYECWLAEVEQGGGKEHTGQLLVKL